MWKDVRERELRLPLVLENSSVMFSGQMNFQYISSVGLEGAPGALQPANPYSYGPKCNQFRAVFF